MWGSRWNVTRSSTAARSGVNKVSPASASPPPMIRVRGSSRVIAVTRPSASAPTAACHTRWARPSPEATASAQSAASAGLDAAGDADGAGDTGAERHEEEAVGPAAGPDAAFGEPARAHVVAQGHGEGAQAAAEELAHRYVAPAQVRRVDGDAVVGVDDSGYGDPGRGGGHAEAFAAERVQLGGEVQDRLDDGVGAPVAAGGAARLVQQPAVLGDEGGLHPGAAHIEGDDVFHGFHR